VYSIRYAKIRIRTTRTIYHTKTGTVCITITAPEIAIATPISFRIRLFSLNAYHPFIFYVFRLAVVQKLFLIWKEIWYNEQQ
jgi:hypothetical protein